MNINDLQFKIAKHDSTEYWRLVNLRDIVLRQPLNLKFSKEELQAEEDYLHIGAYKNENLVANLTLVKEKNNTLKMRQVCTHPQYQGLGIGFKMAKFAEKWAKENGYTTIYCHARETAVPFYTKLGYSQKGEKFEEIGLPHFVYYKKL